MAVKRIKEWARKATLAGTEALWLQDGSGVGSSKHTLLSDVLAYIKAALGLAGSASTTLAVAGVTNVSAVSLDSFSWARNGATVSFAAQLTLTATANATNTTFTIALPVASTFAAISDAAGVVAVGQAGAGFVRADTASGLLLAQFTSTSTGAVGLRLSGQYIVR